MKARRAAETKTQELFCYFAYPINTAAFMTFKFYGQNEANNRQANYKQGFG